MRRKSYSRLLEASNFEHLFTFFSLHLPAENNNKYSIFKIRHVQINELTRTLIREATNPPGHRKTFDYFSSNNTFSILIYPLKNVHGIRLVTWPVNLKIPSWTCGWPTNDRTGFRIRISDRLSSRNFMEEILSWQVTWQDWYLTRILGRFFKIIVTLETTILDLKMMVK